MSDQDHPLDPAAQRWFGRASDDLGARERRVLHKAASRQPLSHDVNQSFEQELTAGQRLADQVARVGGSWGFITGFAVFLALWTAANLALRGEAFDPYPFIFLNLLLSMLAAIQAPIIMMSQNRQTAKDRADAAHDYEVNLKAEIEIMALHDKLDAMREEQLRLLLLRQQEQIDLLSRLVSGGGSSRADPPPAR